MIKINNTVVTPKYFPDGTLLLNDISIYGKYVTIQWLFDNNEELFILQMIVLHLREKFDLELINLYMPYIPNARQDRTYYNKEVFTLKYFCQFINSLNFNEVRVLHPHSNVSLALLNNVVEDDLHIDTINELLININPDFIFYPDAGCKKQLEKNIKHPYLYAEKDRNWETGEILGLDILGKIPTKPFDVLIVDDIIAYGGSAFHSAKKLKELGARNIYLYITHSENSVLKGKFKVDGKDGEFSLLDTGLITKLYTTDTIFRGEHKLIQVVDCITRDIK